MPGTSSQYLSTEASASTGLLAYMQVARQLGNAILDLIFPPRCARCGRVDTRWCSTCQHDLDSISVHPQYRVVEGLNSVVATGVHDGALQDAIQALKYENTTLLAQALGMRLVQCLAQTHWTIDTIVPVPLHPSRLAERGYNQSQLLGDVLAAQQAAPCQPDAIVRNRVTQSQVGLNQVERQQNMVDAFSAHPDSVANRTVLLIDDVCTTGSTLTACAIAARQAGAAAVYGLTVSTARG